MSVSGLCQVCESAEASHTCDQCGRAVCDQHHNDAFGLCLDCSAEAGGGGAETDDGPGRSDAGDDVRF
ncbi:MULTISPECIES: hypothetical protein [Halococcus]|uniref:HIT-type domain-containing protein n=1 Tax=Halococcus salifodinae DSM 8989 TaxID=1227456 RepID=M0MVP4_9EURY|nr:MULTISPECIES: hypothetical protein [Halococcus]EMA49398.1 hypothetical protein C450_16907 [Halococcus salifodinae DSM 8989]